MLQLDQNKHCEQSPFVLLEYDVSRGHETLICSKRNPKLTYKATARVDGVVGCLFDGVDARAFMESTFQDDLVIPPIVIEMKTDEAILSESSIHQSVLGALIANGKFRYEALSVIIEGISLIQFRTKSNQTRFILASASQWQFGVVELTNGQYRYWCTSPESSIAYKGMPLSKYGPEGEVDVLVRKCREDLLIYVYYLVGTTI